MKFWTAQCSQPGARPYNEERIFCERTDQGLLALVADGLGGHGGGAEAALVADQGKWAVVHVGDFRCYHFRDGQLLSRTIDHSVSQMEALAGRISDREIRFYVDRNKVLRALGGGEEVRPEIRPAEPLQPGDCFLLCSDGFWEYVWEEEMLADLVKSRTPEDWLRYMAGRIGKRLNSHSDNFSAVAVFCR